MSTGGNSVKVIVSADDRDLLNTWQKQNAEILKTQRSLAKMGQMGDQAGRKTAQGINGAIGSARQFIQAIAGVSSIVGGIALIAQQLRREYDNLLQRQKTSADRQIDFADAVSQTVRNAGGLLSAKEVQTAVGSISSDTGVSQTKTAIALGASLSARGATKKAEAQESIAATRAALRFAPELEAEGVAALAGVAIDVSKREKISPEAAIGFIQNIGGLARVTDLPNLVQNVAPAVNNLGNFGFTPAEAGSLVTTITQGTGDFSGAMSRTASLNFAASIRKAYPGENPIEVINKLRADPGARKKFLDEGVFGKGAAKPTIENILSPGTLEANSFDAGPAKIGDFNAAKKTYDDVIREINSLDAVKNARLNRTLQTGAESISIADIGGGRTSISRDGLERVLRAAGATDLQVKIARANFEADGGLSGEANLNSLSKQFRRRAEARLSPKEFIPDRGGVGSGQGGFFRDRTPTREDLEVGGVLQNLANAIDKLNDETKPTVVEVANDPVAERGKSTKKPPAAGNSR